jgi:hypothetical protein
MSKNWEAEAAEAVTFFRPQAAVDVADAEVAKLIADLGAASEELRTLWAAARQTS